MTILFPFAKLIKILQMNIQTEKNVYLCGDKNEKIKQHETEIR